MKLRQTPIEYVENKFVITEDEVYFVPCTRETGAPTMIKILEEIFDLDDPEVHEDVDERLLEGKITLKSRIPSLPRVIGNATTSVPQKNSTDRPNYENDPHTLAHGFMSQT